jgi:predicted nucleic acid-binding protein
MAGAYLDSSTLVKLAVRETETAALRRHLRRRRPWISSALARAEVLRALLPAGEVALVAGRKVLARCDLVRVNDLTLNHAGTLLPAELRSLDAIHLATAMRLEDDIQGVVTYDERMADAARALGLRVMSPA